MAKKRAKPKATKKTSAPRRDERYNIRDVLLMSCMPACAPASLDELLVLADALSSHGHQADIHTEVAAERWERSGKSYMLRVVSVLAALHAMESGAPCDGERKQTVTDQLDLFGGNAPGRTRSIRVSKHVRTSIMERCADFAEANPHVLDEMLRLARARVAAGARFVSVRALSMSQPWCWAVVDPIARKHIENRTWAPPIEMIEQQFAIRAAKSWDKEPIYRGATGYLMTPSAFIECLVPHAPMAFHLYPKSAIVGVATLERIVTQPDTLTASQQRWYFGPFGWVLKDVIALATPVPCAGKQGLWTVPDDVERAITAQIARAA